MKTQVLNRRDFIKKGLAATAALAGLPSVARSSSQGEKVYDARGLPTRLLGKTGVAVPIIGIGAGSRFCGVQDLEKSIEILRFALDHGFYYWDTAHDYASKEVISEERLGLVLKERRKEVFLATKTADRTYDGAMRQLEESLRRLQTDRLDLYQVHLVRSLEDVEKIGAESGVLQALQKLREERVTRFIGFTGHLSAEAMTAMANRYDLDTMLIALNHYAERQGDLEREAIPAAARKNMGIMAIKVIRPREKSGEISAQELVRYALSLEHVHAAVVGTDSVEVVKKNIELLKNFKAMEAQEMAQVEGRLRPIFAGKDLPWMHPGYTDGIPA